MGYASEAKIQGEPSTVFCASGVPSNGYFHGKQSLGMFCSHAYLFVFLGETTRKTTTLDGALQTDTHMDEILKI